MEKYIDIHSHILPGVDDGAQELSESMEMLRQAQAEQIGAVILTPHQKPHRKCASLDQIQAGTRALVQEMKRQGIAIDLYPGAELLYSHDLRERLADGRACTLAASRYILVEFLPDENWQYIRNGLYDLSCAGYFPIVAHVERCAQLASDVGRLQELIDMGCYLQVNAGSIMGSFGFAMKRSTRRLLKENLVHFVATDAHRKTGNRGVQLSACAAYLRKKCGQDYADRVLFQNAEYILKDRML